MTAIYEISLADSKQESFPRVFYVAKDLFEVMDHYKVVYKSEYEIVSIYKLSENNPVNIIV